jgi:energy-coupling factor transporter ATP-binding protein EcfA2
MIEADGLCKYYGSFIATEDISFSVPRGQIVAFLGPNGAGKSTTMKMLTGYLAPSAGIARIAGYNMSTDRLSGAARLGYLPENGPLYPDMTPRSLLEFFADARGLKGARRAERIEATRPGRRWWAQQITRTVENETDDLVERHGRQVLADAESLFRQADPLALAGQPLHLVDFDQIGCRSMTAAGCTMAAGVFEAFRPILPTDAEPGPVIAVSALHADTGKVLLWGFLIGIPTAAIAGPFFAKIAVRRLHTTLPPLPPADWLGTQPPG